MENQATAPVVEAVPAPKPLKGNLIKLIGDKRSRTRAIIAVVLWLASLGAIVGSWLQVRNISLFDMPWADTLLNSSLAQDAMGTSTNLKTETSTAVSKVAAEYQEALNTYGADLQRELTPEEYEMVQDYAEVLWDSSEDLSLRNIDRLSSGYRELHDLVLMKGGSIPSAYEESINEADAALNEVDTVVDVVNGVLLVFMLVCLVFCLMGGLFRLRALVIIGMCLSILYTLLFAGLLFVALIVAVHVALLVLLGMLHKQCKASAVA